MSQARAMSGVHMEIEDQDDPIIVVRPLYSVAPMYGEFGQMLPTRAPGDNEVLHVEIMVTTQEGCTVYMQLGYEIFMELYQKMAEVVPTPEEEETK